MEADHVTGLELLPVDPRVVHPGAVGGVEVAARHQRHRVEVLAFADSVLVGGVAETRTLRRAPVSNAIEPSQNVSPCKPRLKA